MVFQTISGDGAMGRLLETRKSELVQECVVEYGLFTERLSGNLRLRQVLNWRRLTARPIHFFRKGLRDDIRTDSS